MNHDEGVNYPVEFLNSLESPQLMRWLKNLKAGSSIILLRNLHPPRLCNGTRLSIKKLMMNLIEAKVITGKVSGEVVLILSIPMIPTDMPFEFKRLQFPVRLVIAISINKAQEQAFQVCHQVCDVNLEELCFSHGQLHVASSTVCDAKRLFIYAPDAKTKNAVN